MLNRATLFRVGKPVYPWALSLLFFLPTATSFAESVEFNRDVRPLLSEYCFACHGPDKNKRQADLRLDTRDGLLGTAEDPSSVLPGKPDDSELIRRITSTNEDEVMPPPSTGKKLAPHEVARLRQWIAEGANWEGHWSFQPVRRVDPTKLHGVETTSTTGMENPLDRFILAGLRRNGLEMSPQAEPVALIRRLSFDLRGLPPDPEDVKAFVAEPSDANYERLVDRYFQSPEYGERMAVWWLDLVRYADSVGYHGDQPVSVFPFRHYVINSFNANKRFDQFTVEQLAGDLLPEPSVEQLVASGYNRLGMMSAEGGVQPKEYLAKYIAERVRNVSGTWLGITMGCAECHDHKYDPLTARDFYRFEAFFADIEERGLYSGAHQSGAWGPSIAVPSPEQAAAQAALDEQRSALQKVLDTSTPELVAAQRVWEQKQTRWWIASPASVVAPSGTKLERKDDQSYLATGTNPPQATYTLTFEEIPDDVTAIRLEVLPDDSLPAKGPGRAGNGNFVLTEIVARIVTDGESAERKVALQHATATYEQTGAAGQNPYGKWAIAAAIDHEAKGKTWGWAVMEQVGRAQVAVFETVENLSLSSGSKLIIELQQNHDNPTHTIGRFRLAFTTAPRPLQALDGVPEEFAKLIAVPVEERSHEQEATLAAYYRTIAPELEPTRKQLAELDQRRKTLEREIPTTLITRSVPPRPIRVLPRGNWMSESGELCEPAFPEILPQSISQESAAARRLNRLDLARWLVSPENPLTARTFMNRQWKLFFGQGLTRKLDDLGSQGDWPSHPELLDWLASDFIDSGWDIKRAQRQIVMSAVYRQSSQETDQHRQRDPENRWLARQSRLRLDAEMVRDNALWVSGLLVMKIGGPSVKPYQPAGYWSHLNFPQREWENGRGADLYRRGLYTHWQRQYLHPSLMAFDAPSREECTADRPRSSTPLQSLVLLNDPTYVEAARVFAQHLLANPDSNDEQRLELALERVVSRAPSAREREVLLNLLRTHRQEYAQEPESVRELLSLGATPVAEGIDRVNLAAWTSVTRALLNLHEAMTRY
jgi:hypothetical protein